ncbi:hypothetical protein ALC62_00876, partial [Cyphomyrmex costatus]
SKSICKGADGTKFANERLALASSRVFVIDEMNDRSETTTTCIDFATRSLRTGPFAPKTRHRSPYKRISRDRSFHLRKKYLNRLNDEVNRKFIIIVIVVINVPRRVTSTSPKRRESALHFSFSRRYLWKFRCNVIVRAKC